MKILGTPLALFPLVLPAVWLEFAGLSHTRKR